MAVRMAISWADRHPGAVVADDIHFEHVVDGLAAHHRMRAAGVVADHPPEPAPVVRGRIHRERQPMLGRWTRRSRRPPANHGRTAPRHRPPGRGRGLGGRGGGRDVAGAGPAPDGSSLALPSARSRSLRTGPMLLYVALRRNFLPAYYRMERRLNLSGRQPSPGAATGVVGCPSRVCRGGAEAGADLPGGPPRGSRTPGTASCPAGRRRRVRPTWVYGVDADTVA